MSSNQSHISSTSPSATRQGNVRPDLKMAFPPLFRWHVRLLSCVTVIKKPPFRVAEDGWGEFELQIEMKDLSGKTHSIVHDLNFANARYETKQIIAFKNPKGAMLDALRNSGTIPGESAAINGADGTPAGGKKRTSEIGGGGAATQKKKKGDSKAIDMDKLAEGLQKLGEDDLLQVVQMVHDNKSEDSWMRNDAERKLHTFPASLLDGEVCKGYLGH